MKWYTAALLSIALPLSAADYHVAKTGNDTTGDGSVGNPFLTIQHATYSATTPGDRVIVHAGTYTEVENNTLDTGLDVVGIIPQADNITFRPADGELVIIDQLHIPVEAPPGTWTLTNSNATNKPPVGFAVDSNDDIVIEGFTIINAVTGVLSGQIRTTPGPYDYPDVAGVVTERLVVRNNEIYDMSDSDNVAAVDFVNCKDCEAYDNSLHDVVKILNGVKYCVNATECSGYPTSQNTAGVLSYGMADSDIHHNKIFNTYHGIFHKSPVEVEGEVGGHSGSFHHNIFYDLINGITYSVQASCGFAHASARVHNNIFYSVNSAPMKVAIYASLQDTANPSGLLVAYNNTMQADVGMSITGFEDVRVFNNIFDLTTASASALIRYDKPTNVTYCISPPDMFYTFGNIGYPWNAVYKLADYNLVRTGHVFKKEGSTWTLSQWQTPPTGNCSLNAISGTCATNTIAGTPLYIDEPGGGEADAFQYFRLDTGSPGIGAGKASASDTPAGYPVNMGAYSLGTQTQVGVRDYNKVIAPITNLVGS